jgi:asparaginyl-tRNA synthetase
MEYVYISDLSKHVGGTVTLRGWLYNRRSSKNVVFLIMRDGTGIAQCVVGRSDVSPEDFELCSRLPQESSLMLTGSVRADERAPGGFEINVKSFQILHEAGEYPISKKEHGPDFLLDNRHLWLRSSKQHAIMRVRSRIIKALRDYFDKNDYICMDSPIFTPAACEGTTTLFGVDYFEDKAYLTQSGQLYAEAGAMAHGRVFCFGPTFRAEKSNTRRHLTEFWMVEPEVAFMDLDGLMDMTEDFICYIVSEVLAKCAGDLKVLERDAAALEKIKKPFIRKSYTEVVEIMNSERHEFKWGGDFGAPDEDFISAKFDRPIFIHRYPAEVKAFYMKRDPENTKIALCVDMLAPEGFGEIIGGSQREDSLVELEKRIAEHKLPKKAFEWYLDLRRYGTVPHSGFGMGIERLVAWLTGSHHIRECIPFPRTINRLYP